MKQYLETSKYIDWDTPIIRKKAKELAAGATSQESIARNCFEFVRDEIQHSMDFQRNPVTCKASDALLHGTGFCYAKSHLLAALLRANNIPAGLCYQRLTINDETAPFCLHGLNAIYLEKYGWYRVDGRGNKEGVAVAFAPPHEQLAFPLQVEGEADLPEIWHQPLQCIVQVLESSKTYQDVADNLPDVEIISISTT